MSSETNKVAIRHQIAALAEGRRAVLDDHPDFRTLESFCQRTSAAFGDGDATIHELVAEDDWVVARFTQRGIHQGEWMGFAATGRRVAWEVIAMFGFNDGEIVRIHSQADIIGLLRQLSAPPEPPAH